MKRKLMIAAGSLAGGVALIALAGCASSMVPANTRQSDSGITNVIQAFLVFYPFRGDGEGNDSRRRKDVRLDGDG